MIIKNNKYKRKEKTKQNHKVLFYELFKDF